VSKLFYTGPYSVGINSSTGKDQYELIDKRQKVVGTFDALFMAEYFESILNAMPLVTRGNNPEDIFK
jgi:hypothetical protein